MFCREGIYATDRIRFYAGILGSATITYKNVHPNFVYAIFDKQTYILTIIILTAALHMKPNMASSSDALCGIHIYNSRVKAGLQRVFQTLLRIW